MDNPWFNYDGTLAVCISEDKLKWRKKYLMIYLTKQIVQLPLGFFFLFVLYTQTNSFYFYFGHRHADIFLQIVRWSVENNFERSVAIQREYWINEKVSVDSHFAF